MSKANIMFSVVGALNNNQQVQVRSAISPSAPLVTPMQGSYDVTYHVTYHVT